MYFRFLPAEEFRPKGRGYEGDFYGGALPRHKNPLKNAALAAKDNMQVPLDPRE